jgi:hypothetical protein
VCLADWTLGVAMPVATVYKDGRFLVGKDEIGVARHSAVSADWVDARLDESFEDLDLKGRVKAGSGLTHYAKAIKALKPAAYPSGAGTASPIHFASRPRDGGSVGSPK